MTGGRPGLDARVCAIVPHYACEEWLDDALTSLRHQTRPVDAIVVVDDASPSPPTEVVGAHPGVTLVTTRDNGGPYRAVQAVIDATAFDAYLFQDADDWSAADRLAVLLQEADETGAELIGSHEVRVDGAGDVLTVPYPADVNAALRARPGGYALLHPSSVVGRDLMQRLGGFATGLRFSGDLELLDRAAHAAIVRNVAHPGYYRRRRAGSLTTSARTGLRSPARAQVHRELAAIAQQRAAQAAAGQLPDLRPLRTAPPARLQHVLGPPLDAVPRAAAAIGPGLGAAERGARAADPHDETPVRTGVDAPARPIFVMGAPGTGRARLAADLGRHPELMTVPDSRWFVRASRDLHASVQASTAAPHDLGAVVAAALCALASGSTGRRPVASGDDVTADAATLAALMPEARFIHLTRDPRTAVGDLVTAAVEAGVFYTPETAWHAWVAGTEAALRAEGLIPSDRVLRVDHETLVDDPIGTLRRCLQHAGVDVAAPGVGSTVAVGDPAVASTPPPDGPHRVPPPELAPAIARVEAQLRGRRPRQAEPPPSSATAVPRTLADRFRALVDGCTPPGAVVAVVSHGDPRLLELPERSAHHLPREPDGTYAGFHPADGGDAVQHLASAVGRGATHLAIPATTLWWLAHYDGLREHLNAEATLTGFVDGVGAVFRVGRWAEKAGHGRVRFVTDGVRAATGAAR